ncbi:MAG: hypothetical protein AAF629_12065 [Chloroflexota bacterium]
MTTIITQIAPQRSTQYASLAAGLAPAELLLSPLGREISNLQARTLGGQSYLQFDFPAPPSETQTQELAMLSMTGAYFTYFEKVGRTTGPLLRPLESSFQPALPPELALTRRYRGKTNEMFTHFMCNIARFSSAFASAPWSALRVFDPLMGGGTTLFTALSLGANVAGVEQNSKDVESTAAYLKQFMREQRVGCQEKAERLKRFGKRWQFTLGRRKTAQHCLMATGDTQQSQHLIDGFRPHLIVTDLPYGIQHQSHLIQLLETALPIWTKIIVNGGAIALAWEAKQFPRSAMLDLIQTIDGVEALNEAPYDALSHRVDRVIKLRDVLVLRKQQRNCQASYD